VGVKLTDARRIESLRGVGELAELMKLSVLGAHRLSDIKEIEQIGATLTELEFEGCPSVMSIDVVRHLRSLRFLGVNDCGAIDSLRPIAGLKNLSVLHAWGTTRISDDDLRVLTRLPALRELRMKDRREYRPRVVAIQAELGRKPREAS
jgi:hypothetical protein